MCNVQENHYVKCPYSHIGVMIGVCPDKMGDLWHEKGTKRVENCPYFKKKENLQIDDSLCLVCNVRKRDGLPLAGDRKTRIIDFIY